jgi:hypothetical protein
VFFVLLKPLVFFVLNAWIFQLMFCPCCVLACCVHAPCVWLPFYSGGTSIIVNPWIAVDAWTLALLTELSKLIRLKRLNKNGGKMQEESDAKGRRTSQHGI